MKNEISLNQEEFKKIEISEEELKKIELEKQQFLDELSKENAFIEDALIEYEIIEGPTENEQDHIDKVGLIESKIYGLKQKLKETDYKALKYSEGSMTSDEYYPIKLERQSYRDEINYLEEQLKKLKGN